ncbi:MAG: MmgE/PrpD family protein, partial [Rhizobacter sp.]|nr:MmgE/PrpD family protein [Rhizobacter sp.]
LKSMFGTMCKPLHAGKACENGLLAAMLAARGFDSRLDVIECVQGFAASQSGSFDASRLAARGDDDFHIRRNLFKYHASCYQTHATIEALKGLRETQGFKPSQIRSVSVRNDAGADTVCNILEPRTGLEAKFSLRMTAAMALAGHDTGSAATFTDAVVNSAELTALRDKVSVGFAPNWPITRSEVMVELDDGRRFDAAFDAGVPGADLTLQQRRLRSKFDALVVPRLGASRAAELAERILDIEHCKDLSELHRLTAG